MLCSNFVGETLDCAAVLGFEGVLLVGHLGKFVKLAGGIFQTHSSVADARMEILAAHAALAGADSALTGELLGCATTDAGGRPAGRGGASVPGDAFGDGTCGKAGQTARRGAFGGTGDLHQRAGNPGAERGSGRNAETAEGNGGGKMNGTLYGVSVGPGDPGAHHRPGGGR